MMLSRLSILFICVLICLTWGQKKSPPKIDMSDFNDNMKYFEANEVVVLGCHAEANPPATYEWKFNGEIVDSSYIETDPHTGELRIASITQNEAGTYQCLASNTIAGKIVVGMSPIITIDIASIGKWQPSPASRLVVDEGAAVKITCDNIPESIPPGQFKWYKQDESGGEIVPDKRIAIDQEGSLHFAYVLKSDDLLNEEYKCAISNRKLDTIKLGSPKILDVQSKSPIPEQPPKVVFGTSNAIAIMKHNFDLECVFSGNPVVDISWLDNFQKPVVDGAKFQFLANKRVLRINNVEQTDEGTYTCKGENTKDVAERTINLDVTSEPIWTKGLRSQTVAEKENAVFTCMAKSAKGEPSPEPPVWLENGKPISGDKFLSKYEYSDKQRVLTVKELVKPDDITCFQCTVKNHIGSVFDDGCLNVIQPIQITYQPPMVQKISKGDIINMTVTATTDPSLTLQYKWYFLGTSYDDKLPFMTYDPITKVANIKTENLSDEDYKKVNGTYYREIFHKFERINVTIQVLLKEVGIAGPLQSGVDLWWIALVIGILLLVVVIAIICIVCKRKAQEGVYPLDKKERANDLDPEKDLKDSGFHDLSRADYDGQEKKGPPLNFTEEPLSYEDDDSLAEYGEDVGKFNEDGSFIGVYMDKKASAAQVKTGNETSI